MRNASYSPGSDDSVLQLNQLLDSGQIRAALAMATRMVACGNQDIDFELGMIHEFGGDGVPVNLEKAASCYARAAYTIRCDVTAIYLTRTLIKKGDYRAARRWLDEVATYGQSPRLDLGRALYHEFATEGDLEKARQFYLRAALMGRFCGFAGYARVSRTMGQRVRAVLVDTVRILTGPFIALLIGRKAREAF